MIFARGKQLIVTAIRTLQQRGIGVLLRQSFIWLKGERGFGLTLPPSLPNYETYRRRLATKPILHCAFAKKHDKPHFCILIDGKEADLPATTSTLAAQTWQHFDWFLATKIPENLSGNYVVFMEAGDRLPENALETIACFIQQHHPEILYTDCDTLDNEGRYTHPFFKPDWSPELLFSVNYVAHLVAFRQDFFAKIRHHETLWAMVLCAAQYHPHVLHVPQVLYHRRSSETENLPPISAFLEKGLQQIEIKRDEKGAVQITWQVRQPPKIAVIIPNYNQPDLLSDCLHGLFHETDYPHLQIIVVDTGSTDARTLALYEKYQAQEACFIQMSDEQPFNFSRACNRGAAATNADVLLFLNNDTRVLHRDWLWQMLQWFEMPDIGIVGAKLLYPSGQVQHAGVIIGMSGLADHIFAGGAENQETPGGSDSWVRNYMAVTGACLMIRRMAFEKVGGFDENYGLLFGDVALCLSVHAAGWRILYTPHARLIHHESATHRRQKPRHDFERAAKAFMPLLQQGDPYYNPNLTLQWRIPLLKGGKKDNAIVLCREALTALGAALPPEMMLEKDPYSLTKSGGHS